MIGRVNKFGVLCFLDEHNIGIASPAVPSTITINNVDAHTFHSQLGHLLDQRLVNLQEKLHCTVSRLHKNNPCYICPLVKQRKLHFVSHNNMASSPFDLIHCDIWGPFDVIAHAGHQFLSLWWIIAQDYIDLPS